VMGIIATLSSVVILAVNPRKMLVNARDASRQQASSQLQRALQQYQVDQGSIPGQAQLFQTEGAAYSICAPGVPTGASCVNLDVLVPTYIPSLPQDSAETNVNITGYKLFTDANRRPMVVAAHLGESLPTNGLVGHWTFDEEGGTTALDASGHGTNGTITGLPPRVDGYIGQALQFNNNGGQYAMVADGSLFSYTNGLTYAAWIYPTAFPNTYNMFMGEQLPYFNVYSTRRLHFSYYDGTAQRSTFGSTALNPNQWYHVAATYDSSGYGRVYLNGVQNGVGGPYAVPLYNYSYSHYIGRWTTTTSYPFSGKMDEVRIYNRALSAEEIMQLASQTE